MTVETLATGYVYVVPGSRAKIEHISFVLTA